MHRHWVCAPRLLKANQFAQHCPGPSPAATPELLAPSVCVGHAELQGRAAGAGCGRAHAQQHHAALDALFGLGGGEQGVDLQRKRGEQVQC